MIAFLAIVVVGIGTYLSRAIFILALADREIPPKVGSALEYVGPAVLSSLVVVLLIDEGGSVVVAIPELAAFLTGAVMAWMTRNLIYTVIAGMIAYWMFQIWF